MGSSYLDGNELRTRALNWSDSLAARTQEAVRIGTLHERQVLIVHHVFRPDNSLQTLDVGVAAAGPRDRAGQGAARRSTICRRAVVDAGLRSFTPATICDPGSSSANWSASSSAGWASEIGELTPSQVSLAAPIIDRAHRTVGAMGIFGPPERLLVARQPRGDLVGYVREAAAAVSRELGALPWS